MNLRYKAVIISFFLAVFFVVSLNASDTFAKKKKKVAPATIETFSDAFPDVLPDPIAQVLETYTHSQIRHISVSVWINFNFSSTTNQWVEILVTKPSGGEFPVARFFNSNGSAQYKTIEFDAEEWSVRALNNSGDDDPIRVEYFATTIFNGRR